MRAEPSRPDPYWASLWVTLCFFYGISSGLAWLAHRWPVAFAIGVALFFLLIYGRLNFLFAPFRRTRRSGGAP